jgi:CRISPR-associated endonuclease Cas2
MNERRTYLMAYDIRSPARLVRVHRAMTRRGHALQYSVFAADFTPAEKTEAIGALAALIEPICDDVRLYAVPANPFGAWLGRCCAPATLLVAAEPAANLAERLRNSPFGGAAG